MVHLLKPVLTIHWWCNIRGNVGFTILPKDSWVGWESQMVTDCSRDIPQNEMDQYDRRYQIYSMTACVWNIYWARNKRRQPRPASHGASALCMLSGHNCYLASSHGVPGDRGRALWCVCDVSDRLKHLDPVISGIISHGFNRVDK